VIPRIYKAISLFADIYNISIANEQYDSSMYI